MSITYDWTIVSVDGIDIDGMSNVVHRIHWRYKGTEGEVTKELYGSLMLPSPDPEDFIPYDQVSRSDIIGWLEQHLSPHKLQAKLADMIAVEKIPPVVSLAVPE